MRWLVLGSMLILASCGSHSASSTSKGTGTGTGKGTGTSSTSTTPAPVTESECKQMFDHVLELMIAEQRKNARAEHEKAERERAEQAAARGEPAPAPVPFDDKMLWTDEDAAKIRESYHRENLASCLAMPRASLECALRATSAAQIREC